MIIKFLMALLFPMDLRFFIDDPDGGGGDSNDPDGGGDPNDPDGDNKNEFIEIPGPRGKKIKLPAKVDGFDLRKVLDFHMSSARKAGEESEKERHEETINSLKTLETDNEELKNLIQQYEDEKLTAEERVKKQFERDVDKIKKEKEGIVVEKDKYKNLFENEKINNALYGALSSIEGHEIYNMSQAMKLLREDGQACLKESEKGYEVVLKLEVDGIDTELSPKEAATHWLKNPENAHFIKANLRSGGGTNDSNVLSHVQGAKIYSLSEWQRMISEAKPEDRQKLLREKAAGKVKIKE